MPIPNEKISEMLREIGEYLEMQKVPFKPRAYEKAALVVQNLEEPVENTYRAGGLKGLLEIPGIGQSIAEKIEEFITTGHMKYHEELRRKAPVDLTELNRVEGLGPKGIRKLFEELGVRNLKDLEAAAKAGKIRELEGFGAKSEEKILQSIAFAKTSGQRFVLGLVEQYIHRLEEELRSLPQTKQMIVAGSARRRKETIGDVDILATSGEPAAIMEKFVAMPEVIQVIAHGPTKSSVKLRVGLNVDLRVVPEESYGAALNYFTGSKDHNVALRQIAIKLGYKLNEYGLFKLNGKSERQVAGRDEKEIYEKLGLDYIEPELRENTGEIEAARLHKLPKLVGYADLKGDLQVQTDWTDGDASIEAMAEAAMARGLSYLAVTDHTKRLAMMGGLDEKRLAEQGREIDRLNKKFKDKFTVLKGTECDILKDGSLDLKDECLEKLDVVGIAVHSFFNLSRAEQTKRIVRAMENPHADILFHPTGRVINRRPAYDVDIDEIIRTAKRTGMVLEIDAYPDRSDLKDEHVRKCIEAGVKLAIDSDAHSAGHFGYLENGIAQARRGWAEKKDVINAWPVEKMLNFLKDRKK